MRPLYNELSFEVIFILEVLCRENKYEILEFGKNLRFLRNKDGTFSVSLKRDMFNDHYQLSFKLIKCQLELLFKLLKEDILIVTGIGDVDELDVDSSYRIHVDKCMVKSFMSDFNKSHSWEEYINYKSKKEAQRVENLLKYNDINLFF